jgi:hypothetical protein
MLCSKCKDKPIAKGIKMTFCSKCGKKTFLNVEYSICQECSFRYNLCERCGRKLDNKITIDKHIAEYKDILVNADMDMLDKKELIKEFIEILEDIKDRED